jgi:large subunit ribosomal protein L18
MTVYKSNFDRRKQRVRRKLKDVSEGALRLSVYKSNSNLYAQIIDDKLHTTLVSASTLDADIIKALGGNKSANINAATIIGKTIAEKAKSKGIDKKIYFDRGGYKYHGRIKAIAESARKAGLNF